MSDGATSKEKIVLENNLKSQLLKGCCQVFNRENGREIAVVGCLAVTIKSQNTSNSPLVYFVHINQILTDQDYKSSADKFGNITGDDVNSNNNSSIQKDVKTEPELVNASLFSALPADLIPPGKNFVVKTQTVYEKTVDGEERKVSVSTQGLIDTCDMKAFTGQTQDSSCFKQESQEDFGEYYDACYDQGVYGQTADDYNQNYAAESEDGVYYEEHYENPLPQKRKNRNVNANKTPLNQGRKKSNFKAKVSGPSAKRHTEQYYETEPKFKRPRPQAGHSFGSKLGRAIHDPTNPYVVTRSMHECGYPGCGKRFKWKQHLLRHQTEKHGRVPSKKLAFEKVLVRNPNYQRQANNSYCTRISGNDEYYEGDDYETMESDLSYTDGQDYY